MDKNEIKKDIQDYMKHRNKDANWLNLNEIAAYLGICRKKVYSFMDGVDYFSTGKQHKFLVSDIAEKIYEERHTNRT